MPEVDAAGPIAKLDPDRVESCARGVRVGRTNHADMPIDLATCSNMVI